MSLNWLRSFRRQPAFRKSPSRDHAPRIPLADYDPVRAAFEAECG